MLSLKQKQTTTFCLTDQTSLANCKWIIQNGGRFLPGPPLLGQVPPVLSETTKLQSEAGQGCQNKLLPILMIPKEGSIQANYSYSPTFEETPSWIFSIHIYFTTQNSQSYIETAMHWGHWNNRGEGDSTFPRKLIFIFSVLLKGSLHSKVTKKSDNEMGKDVQTRLFLCELSLAESPYKGFPLLQNVIAQWMVLRCTDNNFTN